MDLKSKIKPVVIKMFKINMGLKKEEKILILTDVLNNIDVIEINNLAKNVYEIANKEFGNCEYLTYPSTLSNGKEPIKSLYNKCKNFDIIVMLNSYSLSHTIFRKNLTKKGIRIASMPGFTKEMFYQGGPMSSDYKFIKKRSEKVTSLLNKSEKAVITTSKGTNLELSIKNTAEHDTGIFTKKGEWGNLPGGEAMLAPNNANGLLVVPKGWEKGLKNDMKLVFKNGYLIKIIGGGKVGNSFRKLLFAKKHRRFVAELGVGTNPNCKKIDNVLEAEKILGTIHIAVGDNSSYPGGSNKSDVHHDFVIPKPTLKVDNKTLINNGKVLF